MERQTAAYEVLKHGSVLYIEPAKKTELEQSVLRLHALPNAPSPHSSPCPMKHEIDSKEKKSIGPIAAVPFFKTVSHKNSDNS